MAETFERLRIALVDRYTTIEREHVVPGLLEAERLEAQ